MSASKVIIPLNTKEMNHTSSTARMVPSTDSKSSRATQDSWSATPKKSINLFGDQLSNSSSDDSFEDLNCTCGSMEERLKSIFNGQTQYFATVEEANAYIISIKGELEAACSMNVKLVRKVHLLEQLGGSAERILELEAELKLALELNLKLEGQIDTYKKDLAAYKAQLSGKASASSDHKKLNCVNKIDELNKELENLRN